MVNHSSQTHNTANHTDFSKEAERESRQSLSAAFVERKGCHNLQREENCEEKGFPVSKKSRQEGLE
jgi:hypothetical protein